jgi:hypothetical protein
MVKSYSSNGDIINRIGVRKCGRKRFNEILPTASCKTIDCDFKAPICDISSNGAFIKTGGHFSVGQEVAMTFTFPATGEKHMVTGEITRVSSDGVGVNFKIFFKDKYKAQG